MPQKQLLSDAFVRNVKFKKTEVPSKRDPTKTVIQTQVSYFQKLDRGVSLALTVSYGGCKSWAVVTYVDGRPQWRKLGTYPQMMLAQARKAALDYFTNPNRFNEQAEVGTFKEVAEEWFKRHVVEKQLRTADELKRHLTKYVYPEWGTRKFIDIRRGDVNKLLDHIVDHHGKAQADAVLSTLSSLMRWHMRRTENYSSPIIGGMNRSEHASRARVLSDAEIKLLWTVCDELDQFGSFVQLLLLTGQRQGKLTTMKWSDLTDGVWTIATEKREKGNAGSLKLPNVAVAILNRLPRVIDNDFVFPGSRGVNKPFNSHFEGKAALDARLREVLPGMQPWVFHDLRRTARSLMSRAGIQPHIAERVLGHVIGGVEGIYDRHSYDAEKAAALSRLANLIQDILHPQDNVIPLRAADAS